MGFCAVDLQSAVGIQMVKLNRRQYSMKLTETQSTVIWSFYSRWNRS